MIKGYCPSGFLETIEKYVQSLPLKNYNYINTMTYISQLYNRNYPLTTSEYKIYEYKFDIDNLIIVSKDFNNYINSKFSKELYRNKRQVKPDPKDFGYNNYCHNEKNHASETYKSYQYTTPIPLYDSVDIFNYDPVEKYYHTASYDFSPRELTSQNFDTFDAFDALDNDVVINSNKKILNTLVHIGKNVSSFIVAPFRSAWNDNNSPILYDI
jgi:hypothetical protein